MQLIGQKHNLEIIDKWEELPQFLIIQGGPNTGKKYLTLYLCKKFGLRYSPMKNSVKNVRQLVEYMSPDKNEVYHFDNFDDASIAAKNSLLKITEEPIPGNYIVITGGPQIKTLESRAKRIIMEPYSIDEMDSYMSNIWKDKNLKHNLFICGINTPAKVQIYKKYEPIEKLLNYVCDVFEHITYISPDYIISMLQMFEDRYDKVTEGNEPKIDAVMLFLNMLINMIKYNIEDKQFYSYYKILDILLDAKKKLQNEHTLRRKMLLFTTFYKIQQLQRSDV